MTFLRTFQMAALCSLVALSGGCAIVTSEHEPLAKVTNAQLNLPQVSQHARINWPQAGWWRQYQDAQLDALIDLAFQGAPDLQVLASRVSASQIAADGVKKLSYPTGGIKLSAAGQTYPEHYIYPQGLGGEWKDSGLIAANLTWDLDIWGRHRAQYRAALGQEAAAQFEYAAAQQSIASNIVALHAQLSALGARVELLDRQIALQQQTKQRWFEREAAGLQAVQNSVQVDVVLAQLEQLKGTFDAQRDIMRAQLAFLVGTTPADLPAINPMTQSWATLSLPNEVPVDILSTRPDIAAAQHYIVAATENIKAVKAEFYPNINLNLTAGFQAIGLDKLLKTSSRFDIVEPAITLPIFAGAGLNAKLRNEQAQLDSAIANYNKTVYKAISETFEQLANHRNSMVQVAQQARVLQSNNRLAQLAQERFAQGITPQMELLIARSSALREQDNLLAQIAARRVQEAKLAVNLGVRLRVPAAAKPE
jgi:NodT family efflux transporter outer membrane factor (OMF) lipoprotein